MRSVTARTGGGFLYASGFRKAEQSERHRPMTDPDRLTDAEIAEAFTKVREQIQHDPESCDVAYGTGPCTCNMQDAFDALRLLAAEVVALRAELTDLRKLLYRDDGTPRKQRESELEYIASEASDIMHGLMCYSGDPLERYEKRYAEYERRAREFRTAVAKENK